EGVSEVSPRSCSDVRRKVRLHLLTVLASLGLLSFAEDVGPESEIQEEEEEEEYEEKEEEKEEEENAALRRHAPAVLERRGGLLQFGRRRVWRPPRLASVQNERLKLWP
ncbi:unnamed protein product, partial [Prorocentrum cordatum]